ncbi:MAG TPA: suppressor of fused domain protein [Kofleriaceae bacterium]|jgi:tetratricopeptide (TPR) repeat protein|nr:suppressor of fused domain protein [Kofleriaceae bacterium]
MSQAAADSLVSEANELFRAEQFGEAAARFERAVSVFPPHALGWKGLGHALLCMGKPHEAARAFDQAIGLSPESATALWAGALAHAEIGNKVIAKDYLRRSIALQPTWMTMAANTPQLASFLQVSARTQDRLRDLFGAFSTRRFTHAADDARTLEVGRIANQPEFGKYTYVTLGLSNHEWRETERPRIELLLVSTVDTDACAQILANLAFHLSDAQFFPEPGTMVRDVVSSLGEGELSQRLPHVYVQSPRSWLGLELPLCEGPPAVTLAQVFPISEDEYQTWKGLGAQRFEQQLVDRKVDIADLRRAG